MRGIVISFVAFGLSLVSALSYHGADFSSLPLLESTTGVQYTASSTAAVQPFETILSSYGANIARIRIWTTGTYDMTYGLQLAKRAKAAGMSLLIDLHYSDTWADSGHQAIPSGWPTDLQGLLTQIYDYTYGLVQAFNNQGTSIDFIQVGNEINNGLLWPIGRLSVNGFDGASELLHSGASAVRAASPSTKTVIHLANGWNRADISYFYNGIFIPGKLSTSDVDVMGFSFYPFYGTTATLSNLDSSMNYVVSTYNKARDIIFTGQIARFS
ncbi:family 53 glycosyl hydrolase [Lanmaoa asiatica]|nr:family 53 glycosyl hydrolase [Lanmaoa asiatica]